MKLLPILLLLCGCSGECFGGDTNTLSRCGIARLTMPF